MQRHAAIWESRKIKKKRAHVLGGLLRTQSLEEILNPSRLMQSLTLIPSMNIFIVLTLTLATFIRHLLTSLQIQEYLKYGLMLSHSFLLSFRELRAALWTFLLAF